MVKWPKTYYINVWFGGYASEDTALLYRTNKLEDFISHVEEVIEKNHLNQNNSRTIIRGDNTFFSFCKENGTNAWRDMKYFSPPDKSFSSFDRYKIYARHGRQVDVCQNSQPQLIYSIS